MTVDLALVDAVRLQKRIEATGVLSGCSDLSLLPSTLISIRPDDVEGEHYIPVEFCGELRYPNAFDMSPKIHDGKMRLWPIYRSEWEDGECFEWVSFWVPIDRLEEIDVGLFRLLED
ncbi:hypothetical protein [Reinekea sp. G2M2-21]|uniref:hypothetical protein n=1 Tax=Reinekea sp. G2M2-21 TaxID=2788942 RepID=UPI0018A95259|nr:hypothetical protein [Reinekea sp. G2M2-21]